MWQVILYTVAVSAAISLVGLCDEKLAVMRSIPRRFCWALAMVVSIAWPLSMMLWMQPAASEVALVSEVAVPVPPAVTAQVDAAVMSAAPLIQSQPAVPGAGRWSVPLPSDRTLLLAWAIASAALLAWLCAIDLLLHRRAARWQRETVLGRQVLLSPDTGPALLGALRPRIVLPRWFLDEPAATQSLILEHEQQHLRARDPLLLRAALLLAVLVPWNLPLWWQLRRLRQAIELDCDARVLRAGAEAGSYGEVLLAVTQRAGRVPAGVVAMGGSASSLERRIASLGASNARHSVTRASAALLLWAAGFGVAGSFEPPTMLRAAGAAAAAGMAQAPVQPATPAVPSAPRPPAAPPAPASALPVVPTPPAAPVPRVNNATPAAAAPATPPAASGADDRDRMELRQLIALAADRFKKRFVVDPRVRASVDMGALGQDGLTYHAFLEVLGVHGFVAVPSGDVVTIIPEVNMRQVASPIVRVDDIKGDDAEIVTAIIPVGQGVSADQLAVLMRGLVMPSGYLNATADGKGLLLVDRVANVKRIAALVRAQTTSLIVLPESSSAMLRIAAVAPARGPLRITGGQITMSPDSGSAQCSWKCTITASSGAVRSFESNSTRVESQDDVLRLEGAHIRFEDGAELGGELITIRKKPDRSLEFSGESIRLTGLSSSLSPQA